MSKSIPLSVPSFQGNELKYVSEAISTEWVSTGGKFVDQFEQAVAHYLGSSDAVACQSGTAGLHISLILAGVGAQDEVIVPTLTFIAAVNPVKYVGAEPVFMDCDDHLCLDADKLERFLKQECHFKQGILTNKHSQKTIKALIYVHVFGNSGNFEKVYELCQIYKIKLIEDATESLGTYFTSGKFKGKFTGTIGDFGVYSFNGNKIITTGGGGMLVCNDPMQAKRAKYLTTQAKDDEVRFIHHEIGYNYRMTNLQAALGLAQLENLEKYIRVKQDNYKNYRQAFLNTPYQLLPFNSNIRPNYWFYSLVVDPEKIGITNLQLMQKLQERNIQTRPIWYLNHLQKPYQCNQVYNIEKALYYFERILSLPCSANLLLEDVQRIMSAILGENDG